MLPILYDVSRSDWAKVLAQLAGNRQGNKCWWAGEMSP